MSYYPPEMERTAGLVRGSGARSSIRGRVIACAIAMLVVPLASCGAEGAEDDAPTGPAEEAPAAPAPAEGAVPWPRPTDPLERAVEAGLEPATVEFLDYHVHAHLDVFVNGEPVEVPGGIGIDITDPAVQEFDDPSGTSWGGIPEEGCDDPCISPLHTHGSDGVLHTESAIDRPNTLGEFFIQWGVVLDAGCVGGYCEPDAVIAIYIDGEAYEGDPADIELVDRREIAIVIGSPPDEIPSVFGATGV